MGTLAQAADRATPAILGALSAAQGRVATLQVRRDEVAVLQRNLAAQEIDPEALGRALAKFEPIWQVLTTPEKERVVRLLVEQVVYDGARKKMSITFAPAGIATLVAESQRDAS